MPDSAAQRPTPSLGRRFARLTWINILTNLTVPLSSLVDTALLGHLPEIHFLAGVALAAILFDYIFWSFGFLRMATTGITAQAEGANNQRQVYAVLYRSLLLAGGIAVAVLALQLPLREAGFALLDGSAETEAAGREYFNARIWGAPATLANFAFLGWFLGREQSRHALAMTAVAHAANIVLDYLLIVRLGWAAAGAGIATAASQYLMLLTALWLFVRDGTPHRCSRRDLTRADEIKRLFRLNGDILLRTIALMSAFALFLNFSAVFGTVVLAANTILNRLQSLAAYFIDGAAFATESLAGICAGAGDRRALVRLRRMALTTGFAASLPFVAVLLLLPNPLIGLLTSHTETAALAVRYAPWLIPVLLLGSLAYIYDGYFLGLTQGRVLRNSMLVSFVVAFLPLAATALHAHSNHLLWAAMSAFMLTRTATLAWAERRLR